MKSEYYQDKKTKKPKYSAAGLYATEKFDGQRAKWDPCTKHLISRYGNIIPIPQWYLDFFKDIEIPLDGEIFFGYGAWEMTGICRATSAQSKRDNQHLWRKANYLVFDIPDTEAGTYLERVEQLEQCQAIGTWGSEDTNIWLIPRKLITDREMLDTWYQQILDRGGEGVMLNYPSAPYRNGRTDNILKYKPIMNDECVIVGYKPGKGRNTGRLGAFIVHPIKDGSIHPKREFSVSGMNNAVRANYERTHPIGTILNYSCAEYTKSGKPRHPVYLSICRKPVTKSDELIVLGRAAPPAGSP
jgi:DNA ligase-1